MHGGQDTVGWKVIVSVWDGYGLVSNITMSAVPGANTYHPGDNPCLSRAQYHHCQPLVLVRRRDCHLAFSRT